MKIENVTVRGLNRRLSGRINFNDDLNVLTGPNGSGKTTLVKACWYIISGNFEHLLKEVQFEMIELETSFMRIGIYCSDLNSPAATYRVLLHEFSDPYNFYTNGVPLGEIFSGTAPEIGKLSWTHRTAIGISHESLFFPTFRRVEGGFTIGRKKSGLRSLSIGAEGEDELSKALRATSTLLSNFDNKFVCSVATADVVNLVEETVAQMDSQQRKRYERLAEKISSNIRDWQYFGESNDDSANKLREVQKDVAEAEADRDRIVQPMAHLNSEIDKYFDGRKLELKDQLFLGSGENVLKAEFLSAGEKQLISFLCYSALKEDHVFIVDEPELSLHLDWQRKLVGSMSRLGGSHQYFFVTHSPAIYSKFSDYELDLSTQLVAS